MKGTLLLVCLCSLSCAVTAFRAVLIPKLAFRTVITPSKTPITIPKLGVSTFRRPSVATSNAQNDLHNQEEDISLQKILQCKLWLQEVSAATTAAEYDLDPHPPSTSQPHPDESVQPQPQGADQSKQHQRFDGSLNNQSSASEVLRELADLSEQFASVVRQVADAKGNSSADVASISITFANMLHGIATSHAGIVTGSAVEQTDGAGRRVDGSTAPAGAERTTTSVPRSDSSAPDTEVKAPSEVAIPPHPATPSIPLQEEEYRQIAMRPVKQAYEQSTSREYRHLADDYLCALKTAPAANSDAHSGAWSAGMSDNLWGGAAGVPRAAQISESALSGSEGEGEGDAEGEGEGLEQEKGWWGETDFNTDTLEEEEMEEERAVVGEGGAVLGLDSRPAAVGRFSMPHPTTHYTTNAAASVRGRDLDLGRESPKDRQGKRLVREGGHYVYR